MMTRLSQFYKLLLWLCCLQQFRSWFVTFKPSSKLQKNIWKKLKKKINNKLYQQLYKLPNPFNQILTKKKKIIIPIILLNLQSTSSNQTFFRKPHLWGNIFHKFHKWSILPLPKDPSNSHYYWLNLIKMLKMNKQYPFLV